MKLLFKSFIVGLGITILGSITIAISVAVISFLEKSGVHFVLGFFFIVATILFGAIYYYQEKKETINVNKRTKRNM